jgi:hypothetical protein
MGHPARRFLIVARSENRREKSSRGELFFWGERLRGGLGGAGFLGKAAAEPPHSTGSWRMLRRVLRKLDNSWASRFRGGLFVEQKMGKQVEQQESCDDSEDECCAVGF